MGVAEVLKVRHDHQLRHALRPFRLEDSVELPSGFGELAVVGGVDDEADTGHVCGREQQGRGCQRAGRGDSVAVGRLRTFCLVVVAVVPSRLCPTPRV